MGDDLEKILSIVIVAVFVLFFLNFVKSVSAADPVGPDILQNLGNSTKSATAAKQVNVSGGYIATLNISATIQDPRWKAFVGWVTGKFTLDDAAGSTIYDWTLSSITGRIYSTRNESSISWSSIICANNTTLEQENYEMNLTNADDNLTATFNSTGEHQSFWVGGTFFAQNSCPTLNTYVNSSANETSFDEMALYDGDSIIYATILADNYLGYNESYYDFQMIVPENGAPGFSGVTPYYLYVEIGT